MRAGVAIVLAVAAALLGVAYGQIPPYQTLWFEQTVDHFNPEDEGTWQQRYLVDDSQWTGDGPIFFYTGNEGDITAFWNNTGLVFDIAPQFGAYIIFAEHRFYGESLPYGNASFDRENIGLLTVEQALADYAVLLTAIRQQLRMPGIPVVAFGGSYGGMLAAWMRISYPDVIDMSLAASAPIPEGTGFGSNPTYYETATMDFAAANARCPDIVRAGFAALLTLAAQDGGLAQLSSTFNLCTPLEDAYDVEHLVLWAQNAFGTLAMCDYPEAADFCGELPAWPVTAACNELLQAADPLQGIVTVATMLYGTGPQQACTNLSAEYVECADQTGCGLGNDGRAWDYQACTEILYFPNTNNVTDCFPPRNWTLQNLTEHCQDTWGVTPRPGWLAIEYGGRNISGASHIIFSNGLLDPWHGGGFLKNMTETLVAVIISDGAHHLDLRAANPQDPPSVVEARLREVAYLKSWLADLCSERNCYGRA